MTDQDNPTRRLLSMLTLTLAEISERSGIPLDTLKSWSSGRAEPRSEGRRSLAEWARQHAERIREGSETPGGTDG